MWQKDVIPDWRIIWPEKITGNNYDMLTKGAILSDDNATVYWIEVKVLRVLHKLSHYIHDNPLTYKPINISNLRV